MKLNKRLLRKVRNRIAKIPESYDQRTWLRDEEKSPCGTAACLAGETIICSAPTIKTGVRRLRKAQHEWRVSGTAAQLLKLDLHYAIPMFSVDIEDGVIVVQWPQPFARRFARAKTPRTRAKIAVAYLDECLKRGKVTW